jgi:hypothetical protein
MMPFLQVVIHFYQRRTPVTGDSHDVLRAKFEIMESHEDDGEISSEEYYEVVLARVPQY